MRIKFTMTADIDTSSLARQDPHQAPPLDPKDWDVFDILKAMEKGYIVLDAAELENGEVEVLP
jgi:hypothetical protein